MTNTKSSLRLLFDHNVPAPLRRLLPGLNITFADERGWGNLTNGDLLAAAEEAGFDVLVTADRNLRYQQNLAERLVGVVVLSTNHWPVIRDNLALVAAEIGRAGRGRCVEVMLPRPALLRRPSPGTNP